MSVPPAVVPSITLVPIDSFHTPQMAWEGATAKYFLLIVRRCVYLLVLSGALAIIATRFHYTLDVSLACLLTFYAWITCTLPSHPVSLSLSLSLAPLAPLSLCHTLSLIPHASNILSTRRS